MKVLAIDPGNEQSAYVIWNGKYIEDKGKIPNEELLNHIYDLMDTDRGIFVAIERVASYGMAVGQTVFDTVEWAGRFYEAADGDAVGVHRVFRRDIKLFWCENPRAKDSNIIQAIKDRFGEKGTKKNGYNEVYNDSEKPMKADIWQAFALGVYFYDSFIPKS